MLSFPQNLVNSLLELCRAFLPFDGLFIVLLLLIQLGSFELLNALYSLLPLKSQLNLFFTLLDDLVVLKSVPVSVVFQSRPLLMHG